MEGSIDIQFSFYIDFFHYYFLKVNSFVFFREYLFLKTEVETSTS